MISRKAKKQLPLRMTDDEYQSLTDLKQFLNEKTDTRTIIRAIEKHKDLNNSIEFKNNRIRLLREDNQRLQSIIESARDAALALLDKTSQEDLLKGLSDETI